LKGDVYMIQFHETKMGHDFFLRNVPEILKAIKKIGSELERLNNNIEKLIPKEEKKDENC